jgi:hypothetical protein
MDIHPVPFWDLFSLGANNALVVRVPIILNGLPFQPGYEIAPGALFAGVDIHARRGQQLAVQNQNGYSVIVGFYG